MGTIATDLLPNATGLNLGNPSQRFDLFAQDVTADAFTSNSPNAATTGELNLASTDTIAWRNAANSADVLLSKSQGAGALPADTLQWPNGVSAPEFITATVNPATAGVVRLAKSDAIEFRNNANSGDLNGLALNSDNTVQVGDAAGVKSGAITSTGTITSGGTFATPAGTSVTVQPAGTSGDGATLAATASAVTGGSVNITAGAGTAGNGGIVTITGGASATSAIGGNIVLVPGTGASAQGSCVLNGDVHITKTITSYNGLTTTGNGTPAIVATVDLPDQTAASGATLYTTSMAGQYELSWNAKVTTAAGVSSTLGPLTLLYINADGVTVTTTGSAAQISAGTMAVTNTANSATSTGILLGVPILLNCFNPTNIIWAFGYASNAASAMHYNIHIKLTYLG